MNVGASSKVSQPRVVCPTCQSEGRKSRVTAGPSFTTAVYVPQTYDEDGRPEPWRNPNHTTYYYSCSNGHRFHTTT